MNECEFPPYTYTPGVTPHPVSDPGGHSFGQRPAPLREADVIELERCAAYRWGLELFRRGYYWEAHEEWEAVWQALGRHGAVADFVKGLIKLAAAGVKARVGNGEGVQRHTRRAAELFRSAAAGGVAATGGLSTERLGREADELGMTTAAWRPLGDGRAVVFWPGILGRSDRL
jgi:hypothetical protein